MCILKRRQNDFDFDLTQSKLIQNMTTKVECVESPTSVLPKWNSFDIAKTCNTVVENVNKQSGSREETTRYLNGAKEIVKSTLGKVVIIYEKDGSKSYHQVYEKNGTECMMCFGIISRDGKIVDIYS